MALEACLNDTDLGVLPSCEQPWRVEYNERTVDLRDLVDQLSAGCTIADPAMRAITLEQIRVIVDHVERRLTTGGEVWALEDPSAAPGSQLTDQISSIARVRIDWLCCAGC